MAESEIVANQALRKLADQLECAICLDSYNDPKLLQCFHVFCKKCLEPMVLQDQRGLSLRCPTCRQSTLLPAHGVSGLQPAFHIHHLFEIQDAVKKVKKGQEGKKIQCEKCKKREASGFCRDCSNFVCETCIELHRSWEDFSTHVIISLEQLKREATNLIPPAKKTLYCSKHTDQKLDLYCETDEELICRDCIVRTHRDHQYDLVSEAFLKHQDALAAFLQPVKQQLGTVNDAIQGLDTQQDQITHQRACIEADIQKRVQQLHEALEVRKTQLIGQLDQLTQQKLKTLTAQKDELVLLHTRLNSCLQFANETLRAGSKEEILAMKRPVVQQVKEMSTEFNLEMVPPQEHADIKFTASNKLVSECQDFGQVYCHPVCPQKCHIMGECVATAGEESSVTIHVVDSKGGKCDKPLPETSTSCELVCCSDAKRTKCNLRQTKANEHVIKYQPTTRGRHELHIKIEGKHIRGSPFSVVVPRKLSIPIRTITGLHGPRCVAVSESGEIIVTDFWRHCVSIHKLTGKAVKTFGQKGSACGRFKEPCGVAVDKHGNILVTDANHHIQKFTADGEVVCSIGGEGDKPNEFDHPAGIGVGPNDKIYICDRANHRVQILNSDLTFSSSIGSSGSGEGQFQYPCDVAFDSHGDVYVADGLNHCIQIFTKNGQFLRKFGKRGAGDGELNNPAGVAIDSDDVVYVADGDNHRISLFTSTGHFLTSFGTKGNRPEQFDLPVGVAVDRNGSVYICDFNNSRLQIY